MIFLTLCITIYREIHLIRSKGTYLKIKGKYNQQIDRVFKIYININICKMHSSLVVSESTVLHSHSSIPDCRLGKVRLTFHLLGAIKLVASLLAN